MVYALWMTVRAFPNFTCGLDGEGWNSENDGGFRAFGNFGLKKAKRFHFMGW